MSFSAQIKHEVARILPDQRCCLRAELAGLACVAGSIRLGAREGSFVLATTRAVVARKAFKLSKKLGWPATILVREQTRPRRYHLFEVQIPIRHENHSILLELGLANRRDRLNDHVDTRVLDRICCRRSFLRGCFLGSGFISEPGHSYQLEFDLGTGEAAAAVAGVLEHFGLFCSLRERRGDYRVYLKDADQVGEFLRIIGAEQGVLVYENRRVLKDMRNQVNRLVNAETANLKKSVETGLRQVAMIKKIESAIGLAALSPGLRELAGLRLRHPEASLGELGKLLSRPLGKSGVNHRMRQLQEIAKKVGYSPD